MGLASKSSINWTLNFDCASVICSRVELQMILLATLNKGVCHSPLLHLTGVGTLENWPQVRDDREWVFSGSLWRGCQCHRSVILGGVFSTKTSSWALGLCRLRLIMKSLWKTGSTGIEDTGTHPIWSSWLAWVEASHLPLNLVVSESDRWGVIG